MTMTVVPADVARSQVWIVDDSPLEAEIVRRSLAPSYAVEVFGDGASFVEQLASVPAPDAVILDWQMPGIGGLEICRFLRSRPETQSLPILVLTVHRETADLVRCLAAGADDFLAKPCNPAELTARLAALVRSKRMRERLESAERELRLMIMQLPEALLGVKPDGRVSFVNYQGERMLGREAAQILGRPLREVLPGFEAGILRACELRERPSAALSDVVVGDRVFSPAVRRFGGVDATDTTFSFRDVTAERRYAQERASLLAAEQAARAQAEAANAAKDEFLAIVSHELRTPLNAILGWTRLLRTGPSDEVKVDRGLAVIERNAVAQQKLVEDILDVGRIISGKLAIEPGPVDVAAIVRSAAETVRPAAEAKSIAFEALVDERQPAVTGDAHRLQQVVGNLLTNAVKFTPRGGRVTLEARHLDGVVMVQVRDTGMGIEPAFLPHVFERFRQADSSTTRAHGGLGLGLSIVRYLVELHGGEVRAHSDGPGKGATFEVRLPVAAAQASGPRSDGSLDGAEQAAQDRALQGLSVLVVDDEADSRDFLVEVLARKGARVVAVASVAEAFTALRARRPDVVVSDVGMPCEDGYALAVKLRAMSSAEGGRTPAIALTAYASAQDRAHALSCGFDAHLQKPVTADVLLRTVARLAAGVSGAP